jgi:hypothetical protein
MGLETRKPKNLRVPSAPVPKGEGPGAPSTLRTAQSKDLRLHSADELNAMKRHDFSEDYALDTDLQIISSICVS